MDETSVTILEEANDLINGERARQYGSAEDSFNNIADYWSVYINRLVRQAYLDDTPVPVMLSSYDVANMMMLMKISRAQKRHHRDSYVDIAGYAGCTDFFNG